MIKKLLAVTVVMVLTFVLMVSCAPKAQPTTPADFYKGKTIDFVITTSAGSNSDLISRILASYLGRDTGANVIVTNRDGAGGLEGMNYAYRSEPDGLTMGTVASTKFVANRVMKEAAAVYEIDTFSYIMSVGRQSYYFFISPESPHQTIADLQAERELKIGGSSPAGSISLGGLTVIKLLDLDAKVITGIGKETDRALAVKRGEIIGYCLNIPNAAASIEAGMVKPMFVLATERDPLMPDVPAITELISLTDEDLALVKLWETALVGSTLFAASPHIPEGRLEYLRGLANKWIEDDAFRKEVNAISGYEIQTYLTGEEVAQAMMDAAAALDKFQVIFAELIEKYRA